MQISLFPYAWGRPQNLKSCKLWLLLPVAFTVLLSSCGDDENTDIVIDPDGDPSVGPMPLRRLNLTEYDNTVRDLLNVESKPSQQFQFATDVNEGFDFPLAADAVSTLEVRKYGNAAQSLASEVNLSDILPCSSEDRACAKQFVDSFGLRAYRRPVTSNEQTQLMALYDEARGDVLGLEFDDSIRLLVEAMLQSTGFLYRWELNSHRAIPDGLYVQLDSYEIASRLSYFIWRSMPDAQLLRAAADNKLTTKDGIEKEARRLLASDKAKQPVASFFEYWLGYSDLVNRDKNQEVYPQFTPSLKVSMLEESRVFIENIIFGGSGQFESLFTSTESFGNAELGALYGTGDTGDSALVPVQLNESQRGGILTLSAFLADKGAADGSNPALRGSVLYEQLLCEHLPPPPNVIPPVEPVSAGGTTRDRFETHTGNPCASSCHALFDPIGFAFENYDGIGQYRTTDNNLPVNAETVLELDGDQHTVDGAVDLSLVLSTSATVQACFARQWVRYALDREEFEFDDEPSIDFIERTFLQSGDVKELIISIATSRSFMYRTPSTGEEIQQ